MNELNQSMLCGSNKCVYLFITQANYNDMGLRGNWNMYMENLKHMQTVKNHIAQTAVGYILSHWGRDKMAAIFQTTFSNAFFLMKMFKFWLRFHWSLFPINNIPALVQIMAWRRPGDKPLSEPMMVSLLTHICVTRPQWVIDLQVAVLYISC